MRRISVLLVLSAVLAALVPAAPASAQTTFQLLGDFYVTSLSADGTSATGNGIGYEVVRWTAETGPVYLGLPSVPLTGKGGGAPDISADGNLIAGNIANEDSTISTWGLWTKGMGWERLMPPFAPGAGVTDGDAGTPWAISGDGTKAVGLIWFSGRGHAAAWTRDTGVVDLGVRAPGGRARANAVNHDGSVVGGWSDGPDGSTYPGMWQPTVWEDGVLTVLEETPVACDIKGFNSDGTIAVGALYNPANMIREPAIWTKSGGSWTGQRLGTLPGSSAYDTHALTQAVTDDGSLIVGEYLFDLWYRVGFVWTLEQGLMTADEYFVARGVPMPAGFTVTGLSDVTRYGRHISGWGYDEANPNQPVSFIVTFPPVSAVPDVAVATAPGLEPAWPNPFNPETSLAVVLDRDQQVRLTVYDTRGALVRELHTGHLAAGRHVFRWDGRLADGALAPSGVYLARATGPDGGSQVRRLALVK